ncbi:uncharacterized protein FPRO_00174 [Fusarium proliferatum ET1]|uniref:Uncharacterized protein n=1 Tax=Fusarium proliferatum (strain ET1) TaxID=1227346 RepID=A0A1L7V489_FUSPR|nr:uncharacterized protein FPRO_00174 [Fusarium proliferatum ET1]CZR35703.1 uncharacterized protein FPRO_00174 [Fusarium proliferatum ET1]
MPSAANTYPNITTASQSSTSSTALIPTITKTTMAPNPSNLERIPQEVLLHITRLLIFRGASRLARTSKHLHRTLNREIYKLAGRYDSWYPLFFAASTSNIATLELCFEFGAVIDTHWPLNETMTFGYGQRLYLSLGCRPLRQAISSLQYVAVDWLLQHGADPDETLLEAVLIHRREAPLSLAFRCGRGSWERVLPSRSIIFTLLEAGADLNDVDEGPAEEIEAMYDDRSYITPYWYS